MKPSHTQATLLHSLMRSGRLRELAKGQVLQSTDQSTINLLIQGHVKRYLISNDGSLGTQIIYGPDNVFPITMVFKTLFNQSIYEGPETFYYEAMNSVKIYSLDSTTLLSAVEKNPMLYKELLVEAGKRLHSTLQGLENLSLKSSYKRIAHQILYFGRYFGRNTGSVTKIEVPLTHQNIADMLGLTRETVSINVSALKKNNLIRVNGDIEIPDIKKLEDEAYS